MGALIRAMDWSQTPLGPVEQWSLSLRTTVTILLANRFPLLLWWGPEYVSIYNDAYRPVLGAKHPWALGRPVRDCWSEIWHILQPLIDTPFHGGPATWDDDLTLEINRHGFMEETHFTVAYSPVPDASVPSGIGGVLATVHEITQQVVQDRRMVVLRDLGATSAEAKTAIEACHVAADVFARHPRDVPFALLYLLDGERGAARLAASAGVQAGHATAPAVIDLDDASETWPIATALGTEAAQVVELQARFDSVPSGPWSDPPNRAVVLPVPSSIQHRWAGVLVLGISARLELDDSYRGFCDLVTAQVATTIANARAYEDERRRAEALAELDRAKTAFFSNVSHEFRTPLTLSLGPIEDLLAGARGPLLPEQHSELEVAHRNALRLLRLVNTLLDFSRIEAGRVDARYELTDLAALTADLASTFRSAIERAGLVLEVDCPPLPADVRVYVDREMWEKIVLNLLSNALKFTFAGSVRVRIMPTHDCKSVVLTVADTGTGIPAPEVSKLFERFHRVAGAKARTHEGTGIGLALVQELVKLHGGTIQVESTSGVGSTFSVIIPTGSAHLPADRVGSGRTLGATAAGAAPYVEEALRWLPGASEGPSSSTESADPVPTALEGSSGIESTGVARATDARILLADDNADMRDYVARLLRTRYAVEVAGDGQSALSAALSRPPDLVLADVMMPGLDGFQLVAALRQDPRTREVPVVLLSARAGEEARVEGVAAGADDYLTKPFAARELLARVGTHLELARVRAAAATTERAARADAEMARQHLHDLFVQAPAMICVLRGPDHEFELVNARYLEGVGRSSEDELIGKSIRDVFPEMESQGYIALLDDVYRTGKPFVADEQLVKFDRPDDGSHEDKFFNVVYQPSRDARGAVDGILVHAVDVTQQVRSREAVQRQAHLLDLTHDAIFVWEFNAPGQSGPITFWNPACTELYGYASSEAVGKVSHDLLQTHHPLGDYASYESALIRTGEWHGELIHTARNGRALVVESRQLLVSERDGRRWVLESSRDITATKAAEAERLRLEQDKNEFLASASHDLKNPLASIKASAQLVLRQLSSGKVDVDRLRRMVATIDTGATSMAEQIDELLDVARMRLGRSLDLELAAIDLVALVRRVVGEQQSTTEQHHIVVHTSQDELVGMWDRRRIGRALANLVSNAIKYSPNGGRIDVSVTRDGDHALVAVSDQGIGIPSEDLPHIFEQFQRASNVADSMPGTGVGLTGAQRIVQQHGGTISATSRLHAGSVFVMRLPLAPLTSD